jgi:hypothetical protein
MLAFMRAARKKPAKFDSALHSGNFGATEES